MSEDSKKTGCGCGSESSCSSDTSPQSNDKISNESCCEPQKGIDVAKIRKIARVVLIAFAAALLIRGLLTRNCRTEIPASTTSEQIAP